MAGRKVLVIEDDGDIARLVKMQLVELGCSVTLCHDGSEGLNLALGREFDLVVLDLMLPGTDGLAICRDLRAKKGQYLPILMLTAKSTEIDRVLGLEMGADDYLTKPFSVLEFAARVKALFRRIDNLGKPKDSAPAVIESDGLRLDVEGRTATIDGKPVELTAKEFDLLHHFARHPGRVFSRSQLLDQVWGYSHSGYEHTVNSHINRLRTKIEAGPDEQRFIQTVWGVGYKFREAGK
ncbi:MAG: response regulator transcription factor [Betaproteobacteria bacterium]|jgi:DNA-binding response OmpR family regulator|nr:response regulator transcription factor [Betaproteobacteria bacterium]HMV20677.1 response regulator transcription factor [Rhodocyclaceae bacterium]HMW77278.1 response regulator transcription factor [Rhodocyclaceae bacterium]HNL21557.1 response regulator transcription factor [Rhodocyclaceae bacterium]HNM80991.1 response regulator transcription factor [Rhodocyclaceae bacterium]